MIWLKRGLTVVALAVVLYLFWPLFGELRAAADLFRRAHWGWLAAAIAIQWISYGCLTALNYLLLSPFDGRIGFWRLMAILPAMAFIEVALPSAGASGVVLRARLLGRSGYAVEASTFTLAMEALYLTVATVAASLAGVSYLVRAGDLGPARLAALGGTALVVVAAVGAVVWAGHDPARAERLVVSQVDRWNRLAPRLRQPPIPAEHVSERVERFYAGLAQLGRAPRRLFMLMAGGRVALDVATLGACFAAFGYVIAPGALLTGYGLMLLVSGLAALPGGLGLADASLAVIFARLGAPGAVAVAAALAYRLIAFWLLRFVGFVTWQALEARP